MPNNILTPLKQTTQNSVLTPNQQTTPNNVTTPIKPTTPNNVITPIKQTQNDFRSNENKKEETPTKNIPVKEPEPVKEKSSSLLGTTFDSKWDKFPTADEFRSLYGEEIWEQLQVATMN